MADVELRTTQNAQHGQPEISFRCEETLASIGGDVLLHYFEKSVAEGKVFCKDQTVQFGFMLLQLREHADGTLRVYEPDLKSHPIQYVDSVTLTLWVSARQKYVCESFSPPETFLPAPLQGEVIVCDRLSRQIDFFCSRAEPRDKDSGWFVGCLDETHSHETVENLRRKSLYAAVLEHSDILPFLGLPPERSVLFVSGEPIRVLTPERDLVIEPQSFLDQLNQRRLQG